MNSGKFYVIKFFRDKYFRGMSGTGRPLFCKDFRGKQKSLITKLRARKQF